MTISAPRPGSLAGSNVDARRRALSARPRRYVPRRGPSLVYRALKLSHQAITKVFSRSLRMGGADPASSQVYRLTSHSRSTSSFLVMPFTARRFCCGSATVPKVERRSNKPLIETCFCFWRALTSCRQLDLRIALQMIQPLLGSSRSAKTKVNRWIVTGWCIYYMP